MAEQRPKPILRQLMLAYGDVDGQIAPRKPRAKPAKAAKAHAPPENRMDRSTLRRMQRDKDGNEP